MAYRSEPVHASDIVVFRLSPNDTTPGIGGLIKRVGLPGLSRAKRPLSLGAALATMGGTRRAISAKSTRSYDTLKTSKTTKADSLRMARRVAPGAL